MPFDGSLLGRAAEYHAVLLCIPNSQIKLLVLDKNIAQNIEAIVFVGSSLISVSGLCAF